MDFRRGEVVLVAFPFISDAQRKKNRPALIIQNDVGNRYSPNLIVAAMSSRMSDRSYPTNLVVYARSSEARGSGLTRDCMIHAEVILTVPKASVQRSLGRLSPQLMKRFDDCLRISLALG